MKKLIILIVLFLIVYMAVPKLFSDWGKKLSSSITVHHINSNAYPLYDALSWGSEQPKIQGALTGYEIDSAPIVDIFDLSAVSMPFEKYYADKLHALGWEEDNSLSAGGPGSSITAYKKGSDYIIISYFTKFKGTKPNEPVQCPCDITFSIFSSSAK